MNSLSRIAICIVLAACAGAQAVAGDVFALPSNAAATNVPVFRDDLSQSLTPVPTNAAAVAAYEAWRQQGFSGAV